jgi:hypothetical protein
MQSEDYTFEPRVTKNDLKHRNTKHSGRYSQKHIRIRISQSDSKPKLEQKPV